jgi:Lon protease-like protein
MARRAADNRDMALQLVPLFPLPLVLLPAMPLPLHIFEDRYKEMMGEIITASEAGGGEPEFGVVLAKDEGIINIGCTATVQKVMRRYEDGRLDLLAVGQRRFRIAGINEDRAYLRAQVEFFEDIDLTEVSTDLKRRASSAFRELQALEGEGRGVDTGSGSRLSFQMAYLLDDVEKRQMVLALRSEVERLEFLVRAVPEYLIRQERISLAKRVAPLNGHAKGGGK